MRQRILEAAERVIRRHGFVGTTTRLIATEAGCADGTLYIHFRDRQQLFLALLEEKLPAFKEPLRELATRVGHRTVQGNLADLARAALEFYNQTMPVRGALFGDPPLLAAYQAALKKQHRGPHLAVDALVKYLRAEQALGRVGPHADLTSAAHMLLGACFYRDFLRRFSGDQRSIRGDERLAATLAKACLRVIAPEEPE